MGAPHRDDSRPSDPEKQAGRSSDWARWIAGDLSAWRRRSGGAWTSQPVAEEGGAAVLPPQRQRRDGRLARRANGPYWDKVPSQVRRLGPPTEFQAAGFRAVPGCVVRRGGLHCARNVVLMPSFVNVGAYVDEGTMIDTWATVGSCAQIGKHVHLSGGAGIGGVFEPLQAAPTIIRGRLLHRRPLGSGRGGDRRGGRGALHGRLHLSVDQDRRPQATGESASAAGCRPIRLVVPGTLGDAGGSDGPQPGLRRDRQDRRRPDPLQDQRERPPSGVIGSRAVGGRLGQGCSCSPLKPS